MRRALAASIAALMAITGFVALVANPAAAPPPQDLKISEFRFRGPNGSNDEFVEIANVGTEAHFVNGAGSGYALVASDGVTRCVIPNGTEIPPGGHHLCVNSAGYSLASYPAGNGTTATGDATFTTDIPGNSGLALFSSSATDDLVLENRIDAVGFTSTSDALYREGSGIPDINTTFSIDHAFYRNLTTPGIQDPAVTNPNPGIPQDTGDNAADFVFVDTNGTSAGAGQRLGAPGPENLSSPLSFAGLAVAPLDPCVPDDAPPNTVRDATPDPGNNSSSGTMSFRRRITNTTELTVSRLRLRIADIRTFPAPSGIADMRPLTSSPFVATVDREPCGSGTSNVTVQGTTLEQPPSQLNGGGFGSSWSVGTVSLVTPLGPGDSVDVQLLSGLQQMGGVAVRIMAEALADGTPGGPATPVCLGSDQGGGDDGSGRIVEGDDMCLPPAPVVTDQPDDETVTSGETASFTAAATGYESVRWESSSDGETWTTVPTATEATLAFTATVAQSGTQYRAVFVDENDNETPTDAATLTVDQIATTLAVAVEPADPDWGEAVTLTATVSPSTATGTVQFTVDGSEVGSPAAIVAGVAVSAPVTGLATGAHTAGAVYAGDTEHAGSTDDAAFTVAPLGTTTEVTVAPPSPTYGDDVTFTAAVAPLTATGTVTFTVDSVPVGDPVAVVGGQAVSSAWEASVAGPHEVVATYSGDADHSGSSDSAAFAVAAASTTTEVTATPAAPVWGEAVTLTATVAPAAATGTVTFTVDGNPVGSPVAVAGGTATSAPVTGLAVGAHTATATYSGDANHAGSADEATLVVVERSTTTSIDAIAPEEAVEGDDLQVDVTVTPAPGGGSAQLRIDGTDVGAPVAVVGGEATLVAPDVGAGEHEVTVAYLGDGQSAASEDSATVTVLTLDEAFVRAAYRVILGREADTSGFTFWTGQLGDGVSRQRVADSLARQAEGRRRLVTVAYGWVLERPVDGGGLQYWTDRLMAGMPVEEMIAHLVTGAEARTKAGGTDEGVARLMYRVYLGRTGDSGGVAYWAGRLTAATTAAGDRAVALSFGRSSEATTMAIRKAFGASCPADTPIPADPELASQYASTGRDPLRLMGYVLATYCDPMAT